MSEERKQAQESMKMRKALRNGGILSMDARIRTAEPVSAWEHQREDLNQRESRITSSGGMGNRPRKIETAPRSAARRRDERRVLRDSADRRR
jgi:hypothetical protein